MIKKALLLQSSTFVKYLELFTRGRKYFVAPVDDCLVDLYIHIDKKDHLAILDNCIHTKFYTYKNNLLPNKLSLENQLVGLVRDKIKKYNIEYQEIIYLQPDAIEKIKLYILVPHIIEQDVWEEFHHDLKKPHQSLNYYIFLQFLN